MRTHLRTTLAAVALAGALALTGCSSTGSDSADSSASTGAADSAGSSQTTAAMEKPTTKETTAAPVTPEVPAGHKEVTAPTAGISFAVPEDWQPLGDLSDEQVELLASGSGMTADQFRSTTEQLDIFYFATTPDEQGFSPNINVAKETSPGSQKPTEAQIQATLQQQSATIDSYETVQTANGEGYRAAYTLPAANGDIKGTLLLLPNATGNLTVIYVSGSSTEQTKEIADNVVASAH